MKSTIMFCLPCQTQFIFLNIVLLQTNPACDVSGNSERLPRAPHVDHPENCKVDLAILGDKLQPGLFS